MESLPVDPALLERATWWFDVSWYGLLWSGAATAIAACATVAFLFLQFWSTGVRERHSEWRTSNLELETQQAKRDTAAAQERIAALNNKTAELSAAAESARAAIAGANVRVAEATQKAAEAQLALEKFKTPRRLTDTQKANLTRRMINFPDTAFAMSAGTPESIDFAIDIADALTDAGWRWINWPLGGIATKPPGGRPEMGMDMMKGIETHIFDVKLEPLAIELYVGLTAAGYKNSWVLMPNTSVAEKAGFATPVIIIIGSKE